MLQINNLSVVLTKDLRKIIENFSFTLNKGDKAVIIGEEGNGKSTLLKLIYDEQLVEGYAEFEGKIIHNNLKLGYLAQEMPEEKNSLTVFEFFNKTPMFLNLTPKDFAQIANKLGLPNDIFYSDQIVRTLSGGEKVKLQLALILMEEPDVLLLDEPSNDIDIETLEWLEEFINACQLPILFVSHDETLIENTANVIIHLEQIKRKTQPRYTIARMPYEQYISERMNNLAHQEQMANKEREEYKAQTARWSQIYNKVEHQQNTISRQDPGGARLLKKKIKSLKSQEKRFEKYKADMTEFPDVEEPIFLTFDSEVQVPNGKTILDFELDQLTIGDRVLARNIALNVTGPEHICIIGKNGVGKTTLLKTIADQLLQRSDIKAAYMPQNYSDLLDDSKPAIDFLVDSGKKEDVTKARTYLGSMKYTADEMEHNVSELSGGQRAKLLFLKMILNGYNVLILDEPTRNFSPLSNPVIRDVLKSYNGAIISVSHDRKFIKEVCSKVYRLTEEGMMAVEIM